MIKLATLTFAVVTMTGCASMFLNGAKIADKDYAKGATDGFKIAKCTNISNNESIQAPNATYHFVQGGLFERSSDGTGAVINNKWSEDDGEHYFAWVQSSGWEYIVPKAGAPTRVVYTGLTTGPGPQGATKPTSSPTARCEMQPIGASS
jgi:hypothetical protein